MRVLVFLLKQKKEKSFSGRSQISRSLSPGVSPREDRRFGAQQTQRYRATALGEQDYSDTSELVDEGVERARDGRLEEHPRDGDLWAGEV